MKYHEYVLLSAMESCPRGRRSMIGNHVGGKHCLKGSNPLLSVSYLQTGPLVKRLRHRPFTAVTRVRVPYGSYSEAYKHCLYAFFIFITKKCR